jgi:hypothetical protein
MDIMPSPGFERVIKSERKVTQNAAIYKMLLYTDELQEKQRKPPPIEGNNKAHAKAFQARKMCTSSKCFSNSCKFIDVVFAL